MPDDPADLLSESAVSAAVRALAERNRHHLESMTDDERADAVAHWRELALAVLTAASAAAESADDEGAEHGPGRAVIMLEDLADDGVAVHASFFPELEDLGDGQIAGTPAQIAAIELLEGLGGEDAELDE